MSGHSSRRSLVDRVTPGYSVANAATLSGPVMWRRAQLSIGLLIVVANMVGAAVGTSLGTVVIPLPPWRNDPRSAEFFALVTVGCMLVALPVGALWAWRLAGPIRRWLHEDREPSREEQFEVLAAPRRLFLMQLAFWGASAVLFTGVAWGRGPGGAFWVGSIVVLSGATTAACVYLAAERLLRPLAVRALAKASYEVVDVTGVGTRSVMAWLLGTGVPIGGLGTLGVAASVTENGTREELVRATVILTSIALVVGLGTAVQAARAVCVPVRGVAVALGRVKEGSLDVVVPVYDGTEVGHLQAGFNDMVAGLRERERIRQTFGTYVDPAVAEHVLSAGTDLFGEEVEVTVMFLDVRGFTAYAESRPAAEVLAVLNRLFEVVVPVVREHGGHVDKFVGDGVLAVFGAPRRTEQHAQDALEAAVRIRASLRSGVLPEGLSVGMGLNSGPVVAGNLGGAGRMEFTVIGDVVNTAARIESATRQTGDDILIAERTKELVSADAPPLAPRAGLAMKGKSSRVALYAPVLDPGDAADASTEAVG